MRGWCVVYLVSRERMLRTIDLHPRPYTYRQDGGGSFMGNEALLTQEPREIKSGTEEKASPTITETENQMVENDDHVAFSFRSGSQEIPSSAKDLHRQVVPGMGGFVSTPNNEPCASTSKCEKTIDASSESTISATEVVDPCATTSSCTSSGTDSSSTSAVTDAPWNTPTGTPPSTVNSDSMAPELTTAGSTSPEAKSPERTTLESGISTGPGITTTEFLATSTTPETENSETIASESMTPGSSSPTAKSSELTTLENMVSTSSDTGSSTAEVLTTAEIANFEAISPEPNTPGSSSPKTKSSELTTLEYMVSTKQ
ncbi:hypothetical protein AVEN_95942-1 [Araneus ventricosus]|uniref:Uncharacterized protein n=1 Tax=Araneus ventricosus TaxID=182803 RepID=A0A4Y2K0T1_ARAVE|nr:hypothetical protein AVEN_95942-1 [Araneus ventricosus]